MTIFFVQELSLKFNNLELKMIKNILKQSLAFFNLEVRRRSYYFIDDFLDQKKLLSKQEVTSIFDIGANIGQTSTKYREIFPNATI